MSTQDQNQKYSNKHFQELNYNLMLKRRQLKNSQSKVLLLLLLFVIIIYYSCQNEPEEELESRI